MVASIVSTKRPLEIFEMKLEGNKNVKLERIISALKARKLMKKGHATYLTHIVDTRAPKNNPSKVHIVCEYLDVFPKELIGLPPNIEIKFTVEIAPATTQISQSPYRMKTM